MATKSNEYNFPDRDRIGWAKCWHVLHLEPLKRDLSFYYYFVFWRRLIFKIYPPIFTYASYRSHRARVKDETTQSKPLWCL